MKKNHISASFFLALSLFFNAFFSVFPDDFSSAKTEIPVGKPLTDYIKKILQDNKFNFFEQELASTGQDEFAKNIFIEFLSAENQKISESQRNIAVLDFTQEDFYKNSTDFLSFLDNLRKLKLEFDVTVLFSALTNPAVPGFSHLSGTEVFAESVSSPDETFSVCVDLQSPSPSIHTGGFRSAAPLWLCRKISNAFSSSKEKYSFPNLISSLYRLGFVKGENRMNEFIKNEIPSIQISFSSSQSAFKVLDNFILSFSPENTEEWDKHYIFAPFGSPLKPVILNETFCLAICMALTIITLLSLCIVSFIGRQGERNKIELIKNLYMIPLTLAVSLLGLSIAQFLLKKNAGGEIANPVMFFGAKIIISMIFVSFFYALHNLLKLPTDIFVYSYIIQFIAIFNIFIFSLQDLMLFVPFGIEYILIFAFRRRKSFASLAVLFVLMTLPFIPYAIDILKNAGSDNFSRLIFTSKTGNLSVALALFPFQILWFKILVRLDLYNKQKKYSALKLLRNGLVSTAAVLAFCLVFMQTIFVFVYKPAKEREESSKILIKNDFSNICSVKITKNEFSGMNTNHIIILSEKSALKYEVKLTSLDNEVALYDSVYAYDFVSEKFDGKMADEAIFVIPDYPPREITIDYAANPSSYAAVEVTAFYQGEEKNVILREKINTFVGIKN